MKCLKIFITFLLSMADLSYLISAATFNCNFSGIAGSYSADIDVLTLVSSQSDSVTITGTHVPGFGNSDVTSISIYEDTNLQFIPAQLFDYFDNLIIISIGQAGLTTMSTNAIRKCSKLITLTFGDNNFPNLPANFASDCSALQQLSFYNNNIQNVDKDAFKGLVSLQFLMMYYNKIVSIPAGTFQNTPSLQYIYIHNNEISNLSPDAFTGCTNLTWIELSNNNIQAFPALNLANMPLLQGINCYNCSISAIDPKLFANFPGSTSRPNWYLYFNENVCINDYFSQDKPATAADYATCKTNWETLFTTTSQTTLGTGTLLPGSCPSQKDCRYFLDQNKKYTCVLENVEYSLTGITGDHNPGFSDPDVVYLYFSDSHLSVIPPIIFAKFPNLEFVSVRNTDMTIINDDTLVQCGQLKRLDASKNKISRVTDTSLQHCTELEWIDFTGNMELEDLNRAVYEYDASLKHVILNRRVPALVE